MRLPAFRDWLTGSGQHAISVPAMDGALKPNDALDEAQELYRCDAPDNLVLFEEGVHFSSGNKVFRLELGASSCAIGIKSFDSDVTCLSALDDQLAVGLASGEVRMVGGPFNGLTLNRVGDRATKAPVATCFESSRSLLLALGTQVHSSAAWKTDLMQGGASGSIWRIDLPTGQAALLADGLGFPYGITLTAGGGILVAESWKHRIVDISKGKPRVVVDDLPFYPSRLAATAAAELLVCGFAPRRQLVEFVRREPEFLRRMMREVPERLWIAPALSCGRDCQEPLQGGRVRQQGVVKPWSPSMSYGLVATMEASGQFQASMHCRAGGSRHGITSAIEYDGRQLVTSKGGGVVLACLSSRSAS